jgi:hypothetical protein
MHKVKEYFVNLTWTMAEQQTLEQLVNQYKFQCEGGAYRVHRWRLACLSLVLGNTENKNVTGEWIQSWSEINDFSEPQSFRWLREDFILMLVHDLAEYLPAELGKDLLEAEVIVSSNPPPQKAVLYCPLSGQVRYLKWWIQQNFGDYVNIFWMYTEMDLQERTDMQL